LEWFEKIDEPVARRDDLRLGFNGNCGRGRVFGVLGAKGGPAQGKSERDEKGARRFEEAKKHF
jgi:hypothetical protein